VKGAGSVVDEVVKTLNLFLAFKTFRERMGGTPRRGILFEGPPGTGKTYMAKAMAKEAGVPFLFVSSSAFQSMYYGQTNRKIRNYFKALRHYARKEGGAIGFRGSRASSTSC
jgi:cell division protease FtsH